MYTYYEKWFLPDTGQVYLSHPVVEKCWARCKRIPFKGKTHYS